MLKNMILVVIGTILVAGCGGAANTSGDGAAASGGPGVQLDVTDVHMENGRYIHVGPGGSRTPSVPVASVCITNFGSCPMMAPVPVGGSCTCSNGFSWAAGIAR